MIEAPGIYPDIPEADYHADPVGPSPSLSSSVAKLVVNRSPLHAWHEHPRLNKAKAAEVEAPTKAMDIGTAAHKLILGQGRAIKEIAADDYRGAVARKLRDEARAAGLVPILSDDMASVKMLAEAARDQLAGTDLAGIFDSGTPEATLVWQDFGGVWCRARVDWLPDSARQGGHVRVVDLKTTGGSASPEDWQRTAFDMGYDIQDAFYRRGLHALLPDVRSVRFSFVVVEQEAPWGLTINEFSGQALFEAVELTDLAIKTWAACLARGSWPGYPVETTHMDPPKWRSDRAELRKMAMHRRVENWQRPLGTDTAAPVLEHSAG